MGSDDQWYSIVGTAEPFEQGDLIDGLPIMLPKLFSQEQIPPVGTSIQEAFGYKFIFDVTRYDVVVMSQSCDLENEKLNFVLVCPHWAVETLEEDHEFFRSTEGRKALHQGSVPGYHLLPPCDLEMAKHNFRVVDFRAAQVVPYPFLRQFDVQQDHRVRLNSPYKEYLSQAYARFIMRVALPKDMPPLPKYKKKSPLQNEH